MTVLVILIVVAIIALQIFFFNKNVLRMKEYKEIFVEESSWGIAYNPDKNSFLAFMVVETKFLSLLKTLLINISRTTQVLLSISHYSKML